MSEMLQLYMDEKIRPTRKRRTAEVFASYIRKHIEPAIGKRQTVGLSRADVLKRHHAIGKTHPVTANRVVTLIAAAFSHAKKAGIVPENFRNPAREIDKFREQARERYLSTAELQRVGDTLRLAETEGLPWLGGRSQYSPSETCNVDPFAIAAVRLLLLTGCRSGEILNLRWSEVDLDRGLLHLPDSKTGKKTIVLAAPAMEVLAALPCAGEFVIPGGAQGHRGDLRGPWARISSHAGLQGVRLHDLRHSFASVGAGAGLGLPIIGRLLGHAQPSTTARYSHLADDPLRRASHVISSAIANALEGNPGAEPIPMRAHKA